MNLTAGNGGGVGVYMFRLVARFFVLSDRSVIGFFGKSLVFLYFTNFTLRHIFILYLLKGGGVKKDYLYRFMFWDGVWLLAMCVAVLCGVCPSVRASEDIPIAMITAKTGEAGKSNAISFQGARFAVDSINASGGVLGRMVRLLEYDNLGTPQGSVEAARMAVKDGAVAVVGCNWSSHSLAMAGYLQRARIPMVSHMSTNESVTRVGDCIFRICFTDAFQGGGLARFALENLEARTAVVLVDVSRTYSKGLAKVFVKAFEQGGGRVVWRGVYEGQALNVDFLLRETARRRADVVFVPGGHSDVAELFGRAEAYGIESALVSGDGIGMRMFEYIGQRAEGIYYSSHWNRCVDTPESKDFVRRYEKRFGPVPGASLALAYDSVMVLVDAIRRSGSTDSEKIRDALAVTTGFHGVTGIISFDEYGDPVKPLVINRLKFGGIMYVGSIQP